MTEPLIECENLGKKFCRDLKKSLWYGVKDSCSDLFGKPPHPQLREGEFWANQGIDFSLNRGECLGLLGRNGAGKTTLLKMLCGLVKPDSGQIRLKGSVGALIALNAGFQPVLTGRENVFVYGGILGLSQKAIKDRLDEIVAFAELEEFIDTPVRNYSSGMNVRLGFACASLLIKPDILILDEVLAVGDVSFRAKCYERITDLLQQCAVIFVSHNSTQVARTCSKCLHLHEGRPLSLGPTNQVLQRYLASSFERHDSQEIGQQIIKLNKLLTNGNTHLNQRCIIDYGTDVKFTLELTTTNMPDEVITIISLTNDAGDIVSQLRSPPQSLASLHASESNELIITCETGKLPLAPGTYAITVSLLDGGTQNRILTWVRNAGGLEIRGDTMSNSPTLLLSSWDMR
ncbi:ABC transporter ATP-binding protein [Roseimaritima ulvae]|uniref:Teichoic acids export ATP-binding protein TagH n=1 Tax=Roseimaritima ulvae TaxID=980254 RepID=A0A5B9R7N3_9BACT|nr:ABC transporter ATP-binding protein [Roseimaritima ulvae]QEG42483.1 Teichoic acids export ATP-binding protein TagH [Roseimaritima ulvae]